MDHDVIPIVSLFLYFRMVTGIYGLILPAAGLVVFMQEKSIQFDHDYKSNTNVAKWDLTWFNDIDLI